MHKEVPENGTGLRIFNRKMIILLTGSISFLTYNNKVSKFSAITSFPSSGESLRADDEWWNLSSAQACSPADGNEMVAKNLGTS